MTSNLSERIETLTQDIRTIKSLNQMTQRHDNSRRFKSETGVDGPLSREEMIEIEPIQQGNEGTRRFYRSLTIL